MDTKRLLTESEWRISSNADKMLELVSLDQNSERKLRLFACACCRLLWHWMKDKRSRTAVEVNERIVDGLATLPEWKKAQGYALAAWTVQPRTSEGDHPRWAAAAALILGFEQLWGRCDVRQRPSPWVFLAGMAERVSQIGSGTAPSTLLHDIFGNPFRSVSNDQSWQTPTILALAQAAYEERSLPAGTLDVARLAVLADALEDAGCTHADILSHLRSPGPHVRGCWPVDLLLDRS